MSLQVNKKRATQTSAGTSKTEDRPAEDVFFLEADGDQLQVEAGFFAIFTPQDAHMPGIAITEPNHIKKVVIKVAIYPIQK